MIHFVTLLLACGTPSEPPPTTAGTVAQPAPDASASPSDEPRSSSRSDVLYFVMLDRFADAQHDAVGTVDRADPQAWHGGDIQGLIQRLDHLDALGVAGVWISPITVGREAPIGGWGAFHGYWMWEPTAMLGRFGTVADLAALREALDARGMTLYLDVVYNHVGYEAPILKVQPGWFHHLGDVKDWNDPVQVVRHDVHGLPDLAQEKPEVAAWLRDASVHWLRTARPDGFRVDAVRHLEPGFLAQITPTLKATGGERFGMLGEVLDGDPAALKARLDSDALDAVFDFPLYFAMRDALCGDKPMSRIASTLSLDAIYEVPIAPGPTRLAPLVTLLDNHDLPRLWSQCGGDVQRVASALAVLMTTRGTPSLTWGTEIGLPGLEEPANRADMQWSDAALAHPLHETTARLIKLRGRWPELVHGGTHVDRLSDDLLVYTRVSPDAAAHVIVNRTGASVPIALPAYLGGHRVVETITVVGGRLDYSLTDRVPAGSTGIVRVKPTDATLGVPDTTPVTLTINLVDIKVPNGGSLRFVGAGPLLGHWDPSKAPSRDPDGRLRVRAERGTTLTGKLVIVDKDERATWEARDDRAILLGAAGCGTACVATPEGAAAVRWFWER